MTQDERDRTDWVDFTVASARAAQRYADAMRLDRDNAIRAALASGVGVRVLAASTGMSAARISQIGNA